MAMDETTTREKIFKSIRNALIDKAPNPFPEVEFESPVYQPLRESVDVTFAQEFTKVSGKFIYCEDEEDMAEKLKYVIQNNKLENVVCFEEALKPLLEEHEIPFSYQSGEITKARAGITFCEFLIARFGSIMISSRQLSGRRLNIYPETHIVIAKTSQLVPEIKDALIRIKKKYNGSMPSVVSLITGPSRTADIEKTLVMGAHGPKELFLLLVEEN
jgi:L-lactate dehydrogenase complex protein LldG